MKNQKIILTLLIAVYGIVVSVAGPVSIQFSDGAIYRTHKIEIVQESFSQWKGNANGLKYLFYAYNYPDHIEQYKSLFYKGNYPWEIEEVYADWRTKMNTVTMEVQGIFYGQLDGQEVACIQYSFNQEKHTIQMGFLAKRLEGKWYPLDGIQMAQYQHVMAFFGTMQPEFLACLVSPDPSSTFNQSAQALLHRCSTDGTTLTEECIFDAAEKWGSSHDPIQVDQESKLFKNRYYMEVDEQHKKSISNALGNYIQTLGMPVEGYQKVMYYFSKNETMKAVSTIYAYGVDVDKKMLFEALNNVQKTNQYRTFEQTIQEKPNSN
jgi:hypothetical protein